MKDFCQEIKKQRAEVLERLVDESRTTVFYEAPHHLVDTLDSIYKTVGVEILLIAREAYKEARNSKQRCCRGSIGIF